MPTPDSERPNVMKNFFAGGFAGMCSVASGHPLDLIKVRLQTQPDPPIYRGTIDCFLKTVKGEGIRGLYKGMLAPIVGAVPLSSLLFFGYGVGNNIQLKNPTDKLNYFQTFTAGLVAGLFTTIIQAPNDRVKCLLQIQTSGKNMKYAGPMDCVRKLYRSGGIRSLYKGALATSLRVGPPSGAFFMVYQLVLDGFSSPGENQGSLHPLRIFIAGGFAGVFYWLVAIAPDTLKSRQQISPDGKLTNIVSAYRDLVKVDGHKALFKGIIPVLLRAFPCNAFCLLGFELGLRFLNFLIPEN